MGRGKRSDKRLSPRSIEPRLTSRGVGAELQALRGSYPAGYITDQGYRRFPLDGKQVMEHRWVMAQVLGRELYPYENVHHRNGDRLDNRPENLEIWVKRQPSGQRVSDVLSWLVEVYVDEMLELLETVPPSHRVTVVTEEVPNLVDIVEERRSRLRNDHAAELQRKPSPAPKPACQAERCERGAEVKGYCYGHYRRVLRHGDPLSHTPLGTKPAGTGRKSTHKGCSVPYCPRPHMAKGYCGVHYDRWRKYGEPGEVELRAPGRFTTKSRINHDGYRLHHIGGKAVMEHRLVMEEKLGRPLRPYERVHHKNGDRLDNHPDNLELWITQQPNGQRLSDLLFWAATDYRQEVEAILAT